VPGRSVDMPALAALRAQLAMVAIELSLATDALYVVLNAAQIDEQRAALVQVSRTITSSWADVVRSYAGIRDLIRDADDDAEELAAGERDDELGCPAPF
jgi:hypothetical protein